MSRSLRRFVVMLLPALLATRAAAQAAPSGLLVAANKDAASLSVISLSDGRTLVTVPTGVGPHEVALSHDGRTAVVADYGDRAVVGQTLTVVALPSGRVVRTINLAPHRRPHGIVVLPGDSLVAVTSETSSALLIVHIESGTLRRAIPTQQRASHMVAVTRDGRRAWTANIADGSVSELDLETGTFLRSLKAATMTEGVGVTPDGRQVWVGSNDQNTVTVLDTRTGTAVDTLQAPGFPYRVAMSGDGATAVVPAPMGGVLHVFDVATRVRVQSIPLDGEPVGAAVDADGQYAVVALQKAGAVALVDLRTGQEVRRYTTGAGPDGIAVRIER